MTDISVSVNNDGSVTLTDVLSSPISLNYSLHDYLGSDVVLELALSLQVGATTPTPENTVLKLVWRDSVTDDEIYNIEGVVGLDEENPASIISRADATQAFENFEITTNALAFSAAITASDAYNAPNTLGRAKVVLPLPNDQPPAFNADEVFDTLSLMEPTPNYLYMPNANDLALYSTVLRVMDKLNIPFEAEIDPTLTIPQAAQFAIALDAQDQRSGLVWNPNLCRPRDAVSLRGKKRTRPALGVILGWHLLRNARTSALGIPPLHEVVGGYPFPFTFKGMEQRKDIVFNDAALEQLAQAKVNVVRRMVYDTGSRFVLSDILTQYQSKNSAFRLKSAVEITCYTTNQCINILKRHMLKGMDSYLADADRDIRKFLDACSTEPTKLLKPAEDLGGKPYSFTLTPDDQFPFERVRLYLARRPEGAVRSVIFDDVVTK